MKIKTYLARYTMTAPDGKPIDGTLRQRRSTPLTPGRVAAKVSKTYGMALESIQVHSVTITR